MVEPDKVIAGKRLHRVLLKWSWVLAAALLVSVAVNLNFAYRVVYLDTNQPFHPICFTEADGLVVLTEPMSERYKEIMLSNPTHSMRVGTDDVTYISLRDWSHRQGEIWNLTRQAAVRIYYERTKKKPPMTEAFEMQTGHCKFIRKYALAKPKAK
ncbi:MAG: hypothetical protein ACTSWM_10745 [Alphaproteobacteria bacterium]